MDHPAVHFATILMAFLAIMNPIANAPMFVGLTEGLDKPTRRRIALQAVLLAFVIVSLFAIGGRTVFQLFGITLPAFRIAGGVLIALVGYQLLQGERSSVHSPTHDDNTRSKDAALGIAISPLAMPILAGPGTIATAMNYAADATIPEISRVVGAFAVICFVTWASFVSGQAMTRYLGVNAIKVISRLMGLILAVIGTQMLIAGIGGAVRAFQSA